MTHKADHPISKIQLSRQWQIVIGIFALIVMIILIWDWNWFRGPVERMASNRLGRPVTIGHFNLHLGSFPVVLLDRVTITNPPEAPAPQPLLTLDHLGVTLDFWRLMHGTLRLNKIDIEHPNGWLERADNGKANWNLAAKQGKPTSAPSQSFPEIGQLIITNGTIRIIDPKLKTDLTLTISTNAKQGDSTAEPELSIDGKGTYNQSPAIIWFRGSSVLSLRDQDQPYHLNARASFGKTETRLSGSIARPLELSGFKFDFDLSGPDLAGLYPLIGLSAPPSPPYRFKGELTFEGHTYHFANFDGVIGSSDLTGDIKYEPAHDEQIKPMLSGTLVSKKIVLADLAGFIGAPPGDPNAPNATSERKAQAVERNVNGRVIPETPLSFEKINAMNADIHYRGEHIISKSIPLDALEAHLILNNGQLQLMPLNFKIGRGTIGMNIDITARQNPANVAVNVDFSDVELSRIMQETKMFQGVGLIGGSAALRARGNSMHDMFAGGNGDLKLFISGGKISALLDAVGKIDIPRALGIASGVTAKPDAQIAIRCMIDHMSMENGVLKVDEFVFDTADTYFTLAGTSNIGDETLNMIFTPQPKTTGVLTYRPPIIIKGTFGSPSFYPEPVETGARIGASVALGIIATPLGALIPSITLGLQNDANCPALINDVTKRVTTSQIAPAKPTSQTRPINASHMPATPVHPTPVSPNLKEQRPPG